MEQTTNSLPDNKRNNDSIIRKVFFGFVIFATLYFLITSFGQWGYLFIFILLWGCFVWFFVKPFVFHGRYNIVGAVLIFIILVIISFAIASSGGKSGDGPNSNRSVKMSNLAKYDEKVYNIVSEDGVLSGTAMVTVREGTLPLMVQYNIHIKDNFAVNKKCVEGPHKTDDDCRWIDFYNYAGGIFGEDKNDFGSGQVYPVFCDKIVENADPSTYLTGKYINCWFGKGNKQKDTNIFYLGSMRSFESVEDFLSYNTLRVYDAKPYTERKFELKDNAGTSTDSMDSETAIKNGVEVRSYTFDIVE